MHGHAGPDNVDLDWSMALSDLTAVQPSLKGKLAAQGHVGGTPQDLSVAADLSGEVATEGINPGELRHTYRHRACRTRPTAS